MTGSDPQADALRSLLRNKVSVRPGTLSRLSSAQAERLGSPLELSRLLLQPLASCPLALLRFWDNHPRGHAVIEPREHGYRPGLQPVGRRRLDGVAWVAAPQLLAQPGLAGPVAALLDHLLGSDGQPDEPWLSDGGGRNALWQEVGRRLQRQYQLGYAPLEAAPTPQAYFAWGLRRYLLDRRSLNIVDPGLERLLASTLFEARFWSREQ